MRQKEAYHMNFTNYTENIKYFKNYTNDTKIMRAKGISNHYITFFEVSDNGNITINAKILGSYNNEYSIMIFLDSTTNILYVVHDCPDFQSRRTTFCKHVNKILMVSDPKLVEKLFTIKSNILCKSDISAISNMRYQTEFKRAKHLLETKQYEEAISAMIDLYEKQKAVNILYDGLKEATSIKDPKYFLQVYQSLLFSELSAQVRANLNLQNWIPKSFLDNISKCDSRSGMIWTKFDGSPNPYMFIQEKYFQKALLKEILEEVENAINNNINFAEKSTKFDAVCRIVSIFEILNMLPSLIRDSLIQSMEKQLNKINYQSFAFTLISILLGNKQIENTTDYVLGQLNDAFYSKVQPSAMNPYVRLVYFLKGNMETISLKIQEYERFYLKYECERYIQKLQFIKKLFYDYYDGKPFQYDLDFNHKGQYITISPKPTSHFDRYVFHKLGFDYSHPDYITTQDFDKNYPLLKELFDAPEYNSIFRFWTSEIPQISLIVDFERDERLSIITEANVKDKMLIEWEILKNHLHGSFLSQNFDGQMIPLPDHPLSDKIRPFDIYLCEKVPAKIVENVKYIVPIRKVHYSELPKLLKYDIAIACSVAPLKELKEIMTSIEKQNLANENVFSNIDSMKEMLQNIYLPKKQEFLKVFVEITNYILSIDKQRLFELVKNKENPFCKEIVLAISGMKEYARFFFDIDFSKLPVSEFKVPLGTNIIMQYRKSQCESEFEYPEEYKNNKINKKDLLRYSNGYLVNKNLLSSYNNCKTYEDLRQKAIEITNEQLKEIMELEGLHRVIDAGKLKKHPVFSEFYMSLVKKRKEEYKKVIESVKFTKNGNISSDSIAETYIGYWLLKSAIGDDPIPKTISPDDFKYLQNQIEPILANVNKKNIRI